MSVQTIRKALGELQDDPDNEAAWSELRGALEDVSGEEVAKFFAAARQAHLARREYGAVADLLEIAADFAKGTDAEATVLAELARVCDEELFDDARAQKIYERVLSVRPGDTSAEEAIERSTAKREKWEELVTRYVDEAKSSDEVTFRASLLVSAAEVAYRFGRPKLAGEKGAKKKLAGLMTEITTGLTEALEIDPRNRRAAMLLEHIYRETKRWEELASVLERMGSELPTKEERVAAWVRLARVLSKKLGSPERASAAYQQVLDLSPGHPEAQSALVDFFTQKEMWDHLVSLYDEQLVHAQRTGHTDVGTLLQVAMVHWRMRQKPEAAEPYFERLRKLEPSHPGVLEFFRATLKDTDQARLSQVLSDAARTLSEGPARAQLAAEIATLAEEGANATKAIEQWRGVLRQDPGNATAREHLKRLYRQTAGWNALADLLRGELDRLPADDTAGRLAVLREISAIYGDQLKSDSALVTVLSQIVQLAPEDVDAVRELVRVYEALQRWRDLLAAQTRLAELEPDAGAKAELYRLVARRWLDQFSNVQNAVEAYEKLREHAPADAEAIAKLKELYGKRRAYGKLYELYEHEAAALGEGPARRELWLEMAKLAAERLDRGADAVRLYKKIVDEDAGATAALDALEKQAERDKDFASVAEVLERRAAHAPDEGTRLAVLQKLGAVYAERLKDHAAAAKVWQRVLELQPGHAKALRVLRDTCLAAGDYDGLTRLYGDSGDFEGLAEVLSNAADRAADAAVKVDLSFRAADVYAKELTSPERAFRAYERVLSVRPDDERAAAALADIYEKEEKWTRLAPLYEILFSHAQSTERQLEILGRLTKVVGERLGDKAGAFAYAKRAYALGDGGAAATDELEARAAEAGQWAPFVQVLEDRAKDAEGDAARALWGRIADVYGKQLGREDDAIAIRKRLVEEDPKDEAALAALDGLLRAGDRREDLRWLFELRVKRARTAQKLDLLTDWATLEEEVFGEPRRAIDLYRRVLEAVPEHGEAHRALVRLLQGVGDSEEAAHILEEDRDQHEGAERAAREVELARMYLGSLNKPAAAFEAAERALRASPGLASAAAVMEELLKIAETRAKAAAILDAHWQETGEHARRPEVIEVMIATARSKDDKLALFEKLADVHEELGAPKAAFDVMARAVEETPGEGRAWDRLAALANATHRTQAFVEAIARALPEGQPSGLPEAVELELCERAATLYEEGLGDVDRARPYLDRILSRDPGNERAFGRLKNILTSLERWTDLEATYERAIDVSGTARKVELLAEIALVAEEITGERQKAMTYYERLLELEPAHDHAAKALDSLYAGAERWDALAKLLEKRLERALGDDMGTLRLRLGKLYAENLARPDTALAHLEPVLEAEPANHDARAVVEKCLENPQLRARAAQVLEQVYVQTGANRDLVRVLEVRLETAAGEEKADLLRRVAELRDERLNEDSAALDAYARLVPLAPDDTHARERLLDIGRRLGAHEQVASVLDAAAKTAASPQPKAEILAAVAHIYEDLLGDAARAEAAHKAMLEVDPEDPAIVLPAARALERIYASSGKMAELAGALEAQVKLEDDEARKRQILGRLGEIREVRLDDARGAVEAWRARVDADPADDEALAALDRLYERTGDHRALVEVLRARERGAQDAGQRKELLVRIATTLADKLKEVPEAIAAYRTIQDDFGAERPTLGALARLYEAAERWEDLADTLQADLAVAEGEADQLDLLSRLGHVRQARLHDVPGAMDAYRQALSLQPSHGPSRERLEALLGDAEAKRDAAAILRPLYEADAEHEKLLRVLDIEAECEEGVDAKLAVLSQAVVVTEQSLGDPGRAFDYACRALEVAAAEADLPQWLERAERLAAATGRWRAFAEGLGKISGEVLDEGLQVDVLVKLAELSRTKLDDAAAAKEHYKKALSVRADEPRALLALEELYGQGGEHEALLDVLKRRAEAAQDDAERKAILFKEARLCDETLKDARAAIEVYEHIVDISPDDEAFAALERLYAAASRWDDLVAVLERQIGMTPPPERKARLHHALATVLKDHMHEYERAFDELAAALELVNKHADSVAALEAVLASAETDPALHAYVPRVAEMLEPVYLGSLDWKKLLGSIEARLRVSQDPEERRQLLRRLAKLHEEQAEDYKAALETTAKLLAEDVTDEDTWAELERLARVAGDDRRLAQIYATELGKVSSDEPATAKLAKRAAELFEANHETERALELYRRAYAFAPEESAGTFEAIDRLLRETGKHHDRVALYKDALEYKAEPADKLTALHTIALLQEAELHDDDAAIETYKAALDVDEVDAHTLEALSRLYARRARWAELVDLTRRRADQAALPEDEARLRLELGDLLKDQIKDRSAALDEYQIVVDISPPAAGAPAAAAAVKALEDLLADDALKARVVDILRPIYERADEWQKLVVVAEQRLGLTEDVGERVSILKETARLWEERGGDLPRAFACARDAFVLDPEDGELRAELDRLGGATARWDELAAAYETAIEKIDGPLRGELLQSLAKLHDERRDDPRRALAAYERLFQMDETEIEPLEAMDVLATLLADWAKLIDILARKADLEHDDAARAATWRRIGAVRGDMQGDAKGAAEAYERALELEPDSTVALDHLVALYEAAVGATRLPELYRRRVELCGAEDADLKYDLLLRAAARQEQDGERREAIALLSEALSVRPGDGDVTSRLERLYTAERMWPELLENLRLQAAAEGDDAKRRPIKKRIGELLAKELDDPRSALEAFREALDGGFDAEVAAHMRAIGERHDDLRLEAADALEPALRAAERHEDLVAALELRLRAQSEPADRARTLRAIAETAETRLGDLDVAEGALLRALAEEPGDAQLHADVQRIAASVGAKGWRRYADALAERAAGMFDAHVAADLFGRLGRVAEEELKDDTRAAQAFARAAEQTGDSAETLAALDRVTSRLGDAKALSGVLERRIAVEADAAIQADLHHRLATLQLREFGERGRALATLRGALERVPEHEPAREAIEAMLDEGDLFDEAFEALEATYRALGKTEDLARLFERRVERAPEGRERGRARLELARVLDEQVHDASRAQRVIEAAVVDDPQDADALAELERLAPVTSGWKEAGDALAKALGKAKDLPPQARAEAWVRLAGWRRDKEGDARAAEDAFAKALDAEPENLEVVRALEDLRRAPGRERELVETLRQRARIEADLDAKKAALKEAKRLAEETLADAALAEAVLRALLAEDEGDLWAIEELTRLREQAGKLDEVVALLLRRAEIESDGGEISRLRHRAAKLLAEDLSDVKRATALYEEIFEADPADAVAPRALRDLYAKAKRQGDLVKLLERLTELAESAAARATLRLDLAALHRAAEHADDAVAVLRSVLDEEPAHKEAVAALSELYEQRGDDEDLAELLGSQIRHAEARGDAETELALEVRLGALFETRLSDAARALSTYEAVLAREPAHRGALEAVARLSEGRDSWERAATALSKLVELSSGSERVALCLRLAEARAKLGDAEGIEQALKLALEVDAASPTVRERLRSLYEKEKNWKGLAGLLVGDADLVRDAHAGEPQAPPPPPPAGSVSPPSIAPTAHVAKQVELLRRAADIHAKERKEPADAVPLLERASDLVPQDRELSLVLCDAYAAAGRERDATHVLEKIIASFGGKRSKDLATYHHKLAKALAALGEKAQALVQLDTAFKIDPRSIEILRDLGVLAFETNDLERATKTFKALLLQKLEPGAGITKGEVFYYLGEIAAKQGDKPRAVQMLERAIEAEPSLDRAKARLAELKG